MKKLLIMLPAAASLLLTGCDKDNPVDGEGRIVAVSKQENSYRLMIPRNDGSLNLCYIIFDDHEYVVMTGFRQAGITHSPRCKCIRGFSE